MTYRIEAVHAIEILDSRARPTLEVTCTVDGHTATAGVPSGASTGTREAVELRDGDPNRYGGQGVTGAVANVNGEIADAVSGRVFDSLGALDRALIDLDGTDTKARLGATRSSGYRSPRRAPWRRPTASPVSVAVAGGV
ncbi:MAG: hypothetical protein M5U19_01885 [Microthrixaceae bacterium]|nr:hypothetical protein [Microthrixaceae bacterium]